jgi:hypothetical protein
MINSLAAGAANQHAAKAMERALCSEPMFVLTLAYTESERRFAVCYVALRCGDIPDAAADTGLPRAAWKTYIRGLAW